MQLRSGKDDETLVNKIGVKTAKLFLLFCSGCHIDNRLHVCAMQLYRDSVVVHSLALFHVLLQVLCISHLVTLLHFLLLAKNEGGHLCFGLAGWIISVS